MRPDATHRLDEALIRPHGAGLWQAAVPVAQGTEGPEWRERLDALVASGALHPVERDEADALAPGRQATFVAGRVALRSAWRAAHEARHGSDDFPSAAIRRTPRGAPLLPVGVLGSISHKQTQACAVAAWPGEGLLHVGVDLERRPTPHDLARPSIARRILTPDEQRRVAEVATTEVEARELVHVHFALKEAVYKAIDPLVNRYVAFTEVELELVAASGDPFPTGGAARVRAPIEGVAPTGLRVEADWRIDAHWILAVARTLQGPEATT